MPVTTNARVGPSLNVQVTSDPRKALVSRPGLFKTIGVPFRTIAWGMKDRKSTRLNSSHLVISYAVFCLKKKKHPRSEGRRAGRPGWRASRRLYRRLDPSPGPPPHQRWRARGVLGRDDSDTRRAALRPL